MATRWECGAGDDPDCRKPMTWSEMIFDDEIGSAFGAERLRDKVAFDNTLFNWYQKLIQIRKNNRELSIGNLEFSSFNNEYKTLVFKRTFAENTTFVVINNSYIPHTMSLILEGNELIDLISNNEVSKREGEFNLELKPYDIQILK